MERTHSSETLVNIYRLHGLTTRYKNILKTWFVPNTVIRRDLQTPTVKEEIRRYSSQYSARLSAHPKGLAVNLMEQPDNRRLRRHLPMICLPDS
jgi:hypothetical protein